MKEQLAELQQEAASSRGNTLDESHSLIDMLAKTPAGTTGRSAARLKTRIRAMVKEMWVLVVSRPDPPRRCATLLCRG